MNNQQKPESQDDICIASVNTKLDELPLQSSKDLLEHYLFETAERGIIYFSKELRMAFCEAEKLLLLPPAYAPIIKTKAAALYIKHDLCIHEKIRKLHGLASQS